MEKEKKDYSQTLNLPKTDFPMRGNLPEKEPGILENVFENGLYEKVLPKIYEKNLLNDDGVIVCEHASNDTFDYSPFQVYDEKKYGNITLTFLEKKN